MTYLVERLAQLRRRIAHVHAIRPRVSSADDLARDESLQNDVLFSLLMIVQLVIDVAGEWSSRQGRSFGDYTDAVRQLRDMPGLDAVTVDELTLLPGFRNVVMHEYVGLDLDRVYAALDRLDPVERLIAAAAAVAE